MADNQIGLKSVSELLGMKFYIPSYQRGYRWTEQQVKDLLNDIWEFSQKENNRSGDFYCLQPLVVKSKDEDVLTQIKTANTIEEVKTLLKGSWEVIDGQQRLTTISILLSFLNSGDEKYTLSYETREDFKEFEDVLNKYTDNDFLFSHNIEKVNAKFKEIVDREKNPKWDNIDYYHIFVAYISIKKWFGNNEERRIKLKEVLLNNVEFIWYETDEADPIKVFTRLNIGKISLTNAELIKALFLNRSNFDHEAGNHLRLRQQEIASEWDNIEYTLQNDEFWLFLHKNGYDRPTRIDFIFDLICEQNDMQLSEDHLKSIGTDEYKTFRYFYEYFKQGKTDKSKIEACWAEIKRYFQTFQEWFNDLELYHYVGVLLSDDFIRKETTLSELSKRWNGDKKKFVDDLKKEIAKAISLPQGNFLCDPEHIEESLHFDSHKTLIRKILLVHNVQTIVIQNRCVTENDKYKLPVFYKFPFHLFKREKWNVEHIDSNTSNDLTDEKQQKEWLLAAWIVVADETKKEIENFLIKQNGKFDDIHERVVKQISSGDNGLDKSERMRIWNLALLDETTNKGYHNDIFPLKRQCLIGKDQGKIIGSIIKEENDSLKIEMTSKDADISFIPICTKNAFTKYYTPITNNLMDWDKTDAEAYRKNIFETLGEFGIKDSSNNQNVENNE